MLIPDNFSSILANSLTSTGTEGGVSTQKLPCDPVASALVHLLSTITSCLARNNPATKSSEASAERMSTIGEDSFSSRAQDVIRLGQKIMVWYHISISNQLLMVLRCSNDLVKLNV